MQTDDSLSGNWFESTHRIGGSVSGRNTGRKINARGERDTFTALPPVRRGRLKPIGAPYPNLLGLPAISPDPFRTNLAEHQLTIKCQFPDNVRYRPQNRANRQDIATTLEPS